jgi:ArsR family transcriptional regulator
MTASGLDAGIQLAKMCRALGHPARVAIVRYLEACGRACPAGEIVAQVPLSQSAVSRHLRVLTDAGLLRAQAAPPRVLYRLDESALEGFRRSAAAL